MPEDERHIMGVLPENKIGIKRNVLIGLVGVVIWDLPNTLKINVFIKSIALFTEPKI